MKVLLTGSDGYLGSLAGPVLRAAGHDVVGLDTGYYRAGWLYSPAVDQIPVQHVDLRHVEPHHLEGFDAVVHMAELSNDPLGQLDPGLTHRINHRGSMQLAGAAKTSGVGRFVYMSSCSVYGVADGEVDESSPLDPQTAYAECKTLVERDLHELADSSFHPTCLRNATAFGASPRMRLDIVLNNLAAHARVNREIRMSSDGSPWRPLVHGRDIAKAIACVLDADTDLITDEVFNVGSSAQNYQVSDIARIVAEAFEGCELSFGPPSADNRSYRVDFTKISTRLPGFACDWDAASGARQLRAVFEAVAFDEHDFSDRRYTRLTQLEWLISTGQLDADLFWRHPDAFDHP